VDNQRLKHYGLIFFVVIAVVILGAMFFDELMRYVEGAALIGAAIGLLKLIYESNKTRKLKEAEFVASLNRDFNSNSLICALYKKLEHDFRKPKETSSIDDDDVVSFVVYLTFFETLHDLIQKGIIKIETIDDLFGYRFFIMIHNPTVQKQELTAPELIGSYVNIFKLYDKWTKHRIKKLKKNGKHVSESIVLWHHNMFELHPECIEFLSPKHHYGLQVAKPRHLFQLWNMQQRSQKHTPKENREWFAPSRFLALKMMIFKREIYIDKSRWGIRGYMGLKPVKRIQKSAYQSSQNISDTTLVLSIDTMMVDIRYRRQGIQKHLIEYALNYAKTHGYDLVCATVSPKNLHSLNNFLKTGFYISAENVERYGGKLRHVVYYDIKKGDS
jgi:ribosomal protein S18 acetylase RimI-like enzyme